MSKEVGLVHVKVKFNVLFNQISECCWYSKRDFDVFFSQSYSSKCPTLVRHIKNHDHETLGYILALGGRPKEEGGHKPLKISVNKFVHEALKKIPNKSKFLEEVARPILEKMDPGDASVFLWEIDSFLSQGIIKAAREEDFKQVSALGWLANCLEDARKLCGFPLASYRQTLNTRAYARSPLWKEQAFKDFTRIRDMIINMHKYPNDLVQVPQATLYCIKTDLPARLKQKLGPEIAKLENEIKSAYSDQTSNIYTYMKQLRLDLFRIAVKTVPEILERTFAVLHEDESTF